MEFNGTIIITDPIYIIKDTDFDKEYSDFNINKKKMSSKYFSDYLWESDNNTLNGFTEKTYGVYKTNTYSQLDLESTIDSVMDTINEISFTSLNTESIMKLEDLSKIYTRIGRYQTESGTFGVFYLSEVLKYNPTFLSDYGSWCFTVIEDFVGNIEIYNPDNEFAHIEGIGNISFFTK